MKLHLLSIGGGRMSRGKTIALAIAAVAIGGIFLAFGIALLATLALVGTAVAAGLAIARVVRGRPLPPIRERPLDPSMEVFPAQTDESRRVEGRSKER